MNERDELVSRLEALGRTEPPAPREAFLDALRVEDRRALRRHVLRLPVLLPATAVAALVVGFVLVVFGEGDGDTGTVVLTEAVNATVEIDGRAVDVDAGEALPDGAVVTTGLEGSATVDGVRLGPGEQAEVRRGRLVRRQRLLAVPETLDLDVTRLRRRAVGLSWSAYDGEDFRVYIVLRGDGRVVARRFDERATSAVDRLAPARSAPYVVIVLDEHRRPVARSRVGLR